MVVCFSNSWGYPRLLKLNPNSLFLSVNQLIPCSKEYRLLNERKYFRYLAFPLDREVILDDRSPADIEGVFPETFIISLENAQVFGNQGYILLEEHRKKKFFLDTIWDWEDLTKPLFSRDLALPVAKKIKGSVAVIAQSGSGNYYHWMTEILPRVALLEQENISYDYIYVPELKYTFQKDSLYALGITTDQILEGNDETCIEPDLLIIPSVPSFSTVSPYWVIKFLRDSFLNNHVNTQINTQKCSNFNKIFISRKNAPLRKIANELTFVNLLKDTYGIQPIILEDYSIQEQAQIFAHADLIIAAHGAGLTNLLFARPGTMVIEIFQYHLDETFWTISQQLGLRHFCVLSIATEDIQKLRDPLFANNEGRYASTELDLPRIETELDRLMTLYSSLFSASQLEVLQY